jgi:hypothetical protein
LGTIPEAIAKKSGAIRWFFCILIRRGNEIFVPAGSSTYLIEITKYLWIKVSRERTGNFTKCKYCWQVQYLKLHQKPPPALAGLGCNNRVRCRKKKPGKGLPGRDNIPPREPLPQQV